MEFVKVPEQSALPLNSMMAFLTASSFTVGQYSRTVLIKSSKEPALAAGMRTKVMMSNILFFISLLCNWVYTYSILNARKGQQKWQSLEAYF